MRSFARAMQDDTNEGGSVSLGRFAALDASNERLRVENARIRTDNTNLESQVDQLRQENLNLALQLTRLRRQVDSLSVTLRDLNIK